MAYTSIIPVHRLDRAVDYVMNKEKTMAVATSRSVKPPQNRREWNSPRQSFEGPYLAAQEKRK